MDIDAIPFEVKAHLMKIELSKEMFPTLQEGDILVLEEDISSPFPISVGGKVKFLGYPGTFKDRKAFKIEEKL